MPDMPDFRLLDTMIGRFTDDERLREELQADPIATLTRVGAQVKKESPPRPAYEDKVTYRTAVAVLSAVILIVVSVVGYKWFVTTAPGDLKVPEFLVAIGSTALGALAGLLMPGAASKK